MAKTPLVEKPKSVLDLALQLGTRAEPVMQTMQSLGLEPMSPTDKIDPGLEQTIIDQMVKQGFAADKLRKGKGLRQLGDKPIVTDEILTEALGASESGYNESTIPRDIARDPSFKENPSFFQRLFRPKQTLAQQLKDQAISEEEMNSLFPPLQDENPPLPQPVQPEPVQEYAAAERSPDPDHEPAPLPQDPEELLEEEEDFRVDESILDDIPLEDFGTGDSFDDSLVEEIEELDDLSQFEQALPDEIEEDTLEELEKAAEDLQMELGTVPEAGLTSAKASNNGAAIPNFLEKLFSSIHLSPTETWTIMGFSITVMLIVLGVTISWWLNKSPEAQAKLLRKAYAHYTNAQKPEIAWETQKTEWQNAVGDFTEFITEYPSNPNVPEAYKSLCNAYYQFAKGSEANGTDPRQAEELYQKVGQFYKQYMTFLEKKALQSSGEDERAAAYPDLTEQREAMFRISESYRKLRQYDIAIQKLDEFINTHPSNAETVLALKNQGDAYQEWASVNKEQEPLLLEKALETYKKILSPSRTPADDHEELMRTYAKMGDLEKRRHARSMENNDPFEAQTSLIEAIGYYEKAVEHAKARAEELDETTTLPEPYNRFLKEKANILQALADLYLLRGREFANTWTESEEAAEPYPDGVEYKQTLTDAAKKAEASTRDTIAKAQALYKDIVAHPDVLEDAQHQDILYNNAETHFILRDYPATIAAGETLLNATLAPNPPIQAKTNYLMGHAAWKIASDTGDGNYTQVKEFYRNALDLDPFYGEKGNISHLAEIRLINAYFFVDQKYDEAIRRFEEAVKRYPESDYTYLTYFWYGQACEKYGDELLAQFKTQENSANTSPQDQAALREKAKNLFSTAVIQYRNAIDSRDRSKYKDSQNEEYLIQIMFNRGHCAFKAGSYKEAQQYLSEALAKYRDNRVAQPHIPQAMETLGDIHVLLANYGDAIRIYREYLSNSFDDTNARVSMKLAEAYLNRYSYDQAREWYSRIAGEYPPPNEKAVERALRTNRPIEQGPGFEAMKRLADSYYREASSYSGEDRVAKLNLALDAYKNLIKSYPLNAENRSIPSDPDAQREIGNLYYELGSLSLPVPNYQEAVNNYQAFLASNTNYPRKGMIYYRIGQALLQLQRTDPQAQQNITYIDDAITALSNITETSMDNPTQFAQALILLGQAFEEKANFYLKNGDEALWNRYLKDAENHYRRVGQTNIPDKMQEAKTYIDNIISRVNSRNELANIKP